MERYARKDQASGGDLNRTREASGYGPLDVGPRSREQLHRVGRLGVNDHEWETPHAQREPRCTRQSPVGTRTLSTGTGTSDYDILSGTSE